MSREERNVHYDPEQMAPHDQLDDLSKTGELPDGQDLAGLEREIETEIARNSEPLQDVKHSDSDLLARINLQKVHLIKQDPYLLWTRLLLKRRRNDFTRVNVASTSVN